MQAAAGAVAGGLLGAGVGFYLAEQQTKSPQLQQQLSSLEEDNTQLKKDLHLAQNTVQQYQRELDQSKQQLQAALGQVSSLSTVSPSSKTESSSSDPPLESPTGWGSFVLGVCYQRHSDWLMQAALGAGAALLASNGVAGLNANDEGGQTFRNFGSGSSAGALPRSSS